MRERQGACGWGGSAGRRAEVATGAAEAQVGPRSGAGRWALAVPSPEPVGRRERRSRELHAAPHAADFDCHYRKFN